MINITDKENCCGCNACGDVCAKKAITFKTDNEGFWYPEVDMGKCVDCGLCEKVCPILQIDNLKKNDFEIPICFAAQNKNLESLFNSTSGSAFAGFAEKMYKDGGYVGGAVFNEDYSVRQVISNEKNDLEQLRNTKYVQSNSEGFYIQVKDLLNEGNRVLVCGLPCQMAALRTFLRKDYENLIIVDMICLGINSPRILPAYLHWKERQHGSKIVYYKAKNKEMGWRQLTTKLVFENGEVEYDKRDTNYFTQGFISTHAFARPSCYECKFKGTPRIADLTIGDFWGAEHYVGKEYDHDLGTSIIMVNSQKGLDFYESVKSKFREKEVKFGDVLVNNKAIMQSLSRPTFDRESFYNDLSNLPFEDFAKKYITLPNIQKQSKFKSVVRFILNVKKVSGWDIGIWIKNLHYNLFCRQVETKVTEGRYILFHKYSVVDIAKTARIIVDGIFHFGVKRVKNSRIESRLLIDPEGLLKLRNGAVYYGADIEVFKNAVLELGDGITFNINATIICGDSIQIADKVFFGRDVTVRDNNGGHFISRKVFKNNRPVSIGQHSWLCEQAIVMPGSKIGVGVIVGARSMVSGKIPNFTLVSGSPAQVVDEDIYWKS